jgi:hypothetical protein
MKNTISTLAFVLTSSTLAPVSAVGQAQKLTPPAQTQTGKVAPATVKDITGWGNVKWGMTVGEATAVIPKSVTVENVTMTVRVSQCSTWCGNEVIPSLPVKSVVLQVDTLKFQDLKTTFDNLKAALIRKYGAPSVESKEGVDVGPFIERTAIWALPSTTIVLLRLVDRHDGPIDNVSIMYKPYENDVL